ncbi:hypothetical protein EYS14_05415 [Alteromonadaceae bacterium M269]|nr:hypothetical protein EYS14_05415 [Alteromonadaceae bacterium M269]
MLESRWFKLMKSMGFSENRETLETLIGAYSQSGRYYHNVSHLISVLKCLDSTVHLAENRHAIKLALWFHDSVYEPFSASNEIDSAKWALRFLKENGACEASAQYVYNLIMATAHSRPPETNDERLIVDIDLSVLGAADHAYDKFANGVRKEYQKVPSFIYRIKRKKILSSFLKRERIYFFGYFFEVYESIARENIRREISCL